LLALFLL
jgi:hypothetical protein